jgi:hypothetical protein
VRAFALIALAGGLVATGRRLNSRASPQSNPFWVEETMPKLEDLLFAIEEKFWTGGAEHCRRYLAPSAIMVFPDPAGVLVSDEIVSTVAGQRWSDVELEEHRVLELDDRSALVTYKATAHRASGEAPYVARASSAYVRDGAAWKLAFHQQTPLTRVAPDR